MNSHDVITTPRSPVVSQQAIATHQHPYHVRDALAPPKREFNLAYRAGRYSRRCDAFLYNSMGAKFTWKKKVGGVRRGLRVEFANNEGGGREKW
jgi:hypothetical protein